MKSLFKKKFMSVPHMSLSHALREVGRNAFVDWIVVLSVSVACMVLCALGGVYLYYQVTTGKLVTTSEQPSSVDAIFNPKELSSALELLKARADAQALVKSGYRGPADPSQ